MGRGEQGFSLVSTLIAAAVGMIVMTAVMASAQYSQLAVRSTAQSMEVLDLRSATRMALSTPESCRTAFEAFTVEARFPDPRPAWGDATAWRDPAVQIEIPLQGIQLASMTLLSERGASDLGIDENDPRRKWATMEITRLELRAGAPQARRFERGLLFLPVSMQVELRRTGGFLGGTPMHRIEHTVWFAFAQSGTLAGCGESPQALVLPTHITCEKTLRPGQVYFEAHDANRARRSDGVYVNYTDIPENARLAGFIDGNNSWNVARFSESECTDNRLPDANYEAQLASFYVCQASAAIQPLMAGERPINPADNFPAWNTHQPSRIQGPGVMWHWNWHSICAAGARDTVVRIKVRYTLNL